MVFARFVAIMIMHVSVLEEIHNGSRMMKYAQNHWWKFTYPGNAWLSGFLQVIAMYTIEIANIFAVMASPDIIEIVKDMMALTIISEFDDYFAMATGDCLVFKICSDSAYKDLFTIDVTTSKDAIDDKENRKLRDRPLDECEIHKKVIENMKKEVAIAKIVWNEEVEKAYRMNRPKNVRIDYWSRDFQNKVLLAVYRGIRFFNVTIWTYFLPTFALIAQFAIPLYSIRQKAAYIEAK